MAIQIDKNDIHVSNYYLPDYVKFPMQKISYETILNQAVRRYLFHQTLRKESEDGLIKYSSLRDISISYHIPLKEFKTNHSEIEDDVISFFSLLSISAIDPIKFQSFSESEALLFLYRLRASGISPHQIPTFFWKDKELRNQILLGTQLSSDPESPEIFCITFETALDFFKPGELDIEDGKAKITSYQIYSLLSRDFQSSLLHNIERFKDKLNDQYAILQGLSDELHFLTIPKERKIITATNVDFISQRSFPPCMFRIQNCIKSTQFLSFKGRFEFILFLKAAGLDYFQQNQYWEDKVKDLFRLNLKHFYGLDGKNDNFQPHSCATMISKDCPNDSSIIQGCPFKALKKNELKIFLCKMNRGLSQKDIEDVLEPDEPQVCCRLFFDATFPKRPYDQNGFSHPIDYALESEWRFQSHSQTG